MKLYQSDALSPIHAGYESFSLRKASRCGLCPSISVQRSSSATPMLRSIRVASFRRWCWRTARLSVKCRPSCAIWRKIHPDPPLLGATPKAKALVTMWERRAELEGFASVMEAVRNAVPGLKNRAIAGPHDYDQIPALVERSKQRVRNFYADFGHPLARWPFVAGDEFSVADITGRRHGRLCDQGSRPCDHG